ncbi:MAG: YrhK family protein [Ornithinimicrobium sp.]
MIRTLVEDYEYIHTGLGLIGNLMFVVGSVFFYKAFEQYYTLAVSLFVVGSAFMFIGALGSALRRLWEHRKQEAQARS